ncbi:MAG: tetratricopeptide repeat protein, partial [Acidobacteria bacterium]|nr:tetratricopeptide repeat protein [Acidobacteriota bacterium]
VLLDENKYSEALPILEKLAAAKPDDLPVIEYLAITILANTTITKKDRDELKKEYVRARTLALKAKELGSKSPLIEMVLERLPAGADPDSLVAEKKRTPAQEALNEGEQAFSQGDMKGAIEHYERAAKLDPKLYEAPLFIGDAYYHSKKTDKAGEFYARAIAIDPDRETAYRYWGNVLLSEGRMEESKEKFIEAIIAEPYQKLPWQFLTNWANRNRKELGHPLIEIPESSIERKDDKNINILVDPDDKKDGTSAWMVYSLMRVGWMIDNNKKFTETFPNEKVYRHSLLEECSALRATAENVSDLIKEGKLKEGSLDISIANLLKLHRAELIEAFVLLAIPDQGIARDYVDYRNKNRDKLRKYLAVYVINNP